MKAHRSQGAAYVRTPRKQPLVGWSSDGIPKLLWTTERSVFVSADGETRDIYELSYADAKAMCRVHGVQFHDQSKGMNLDELWRAR